MDDILVFNKFSEGYSVGSQTAATTNLSSLLYHNGVKDDYYETIETIIVPEYHNSLPVYKFGYRCFRAVPKLRTVYIPKTVKMFSGDTFYECSLLENVIFAPNSRLSHMSYYAFTKTAIATITLPRSVRSITDISFAHMPNLKEVYIHSLMKNDYTNLFKGTDITNLKIHVPSNYHYGAFAQVAVTKDLPPYVNILSIQQKCARHALLVHIYIMMIS